MKKSTKTSSSRKLKVIPIGGLHEIGKNMTLLEYGSDIISIDCGMEFPDDEMLGIDVVIPDFTYLAENSERFRGVIITHAHEDHIGALPFLLSRFDVPVYGTKLTLGIIKHKLQERNIKARLVEIEPGDVFRLGCFRIEAVHMTHSVADALAFSIDTPLGKVFHTGDFKIDFTPLAGNPPDLARLAAIGDEGVMLLMCDSTNAMRRGYTPSESTLGVSLGNIFASTPHRIIIATFSSNVDRVQKIIDLAVANGRKVAVSGRSMENIIAIATDLGYLKIPSNVLVDIKKIKDIPDSKLVIITTGSQGEAMSALTRMANNEHKNVKIREKDVVILSSTPVPGNEKMVSNVINQIMAMGATVIYNDIADTHVSGHACQEELKLLHALIRPKYFMPVHGELKHMRSHGELAVMMGMDEKNVLYAQNGDVYEFTKTRAKLSDEKVSSGAVLVDGLGVGDVGSSVLNERKVLSEAGLIVVAAGFDSVSGQLVSGPELISKGFVYVKEYGEVLDDATKMLTKKLSSAISSGTDDIQALKTMTHSALKSFIYERTNRKPVILPVFMEY